MIELDNLKKALEADSWCQECGQEHIRPAIEQLIKALEQPTNMVTIPLDKLEDMQRKLKEQPTKEEILGKVFDAVYAQYQPKAETQEPVLYIDGGGLDGHATWAQATRCQDTDIALYTHPKEWQGLTAEEIASIPLNEHTVQAVENLLRSKNK